MVAGESEDRRLDLTEMGIWRKRVNIRFGGAVEEVVMQTLGDKTEAIEHGHRAMRAKLLEYRQGSEAWQALGEALLLLKPTELAGFVAEGERGTLAEQLKRELPDPVIPRRDIGAGETEEAFARRQAEHLRRCEEQRENRAAELERRLARRREELASRPQAELVELAQPRRVDLECWQAFQRACDDWILLRATRRAEAPEQPYFRDIEQVRNLHPRVKEQLRQAYRALDRGEEEDLPNS